MARPSVDAPRLARGYSLVELLFVVAIIGVVSAIAVPMTGNAVGYYRLSGDARNVSRSATVAKLRAAASFTQARVYVDLNGRSMRIETWQKTGTPDWVADGGTTNLSTNVTFGFGTVGSAPPNTQATVGQASQCVNSAGSSIANTACLLFNSRGIPVDPSGTPPAVGAPTGNDAVYLTDGTAVYAITLSATGLIQVWRTNAGGTASWSLQ